MVCRLHATCYSMVRPLPVAAPGTPPGHNSDDRVTINSTLDGDGGLHLEVKDMGLGWKASEGCCDTYTRFSTAMVVSQQTFGDGFFQATIKTMKPTEYHAFATFGRNIPGFLSALSLVGVVSRPRCIRPH